MDSSTRAPSAPAPRGPLRWRAPRAWRALLAPREPRAALLALVPGDPLELRLLVAERLAARALVADAGLVVARVAARVAAALRPGSTRTGASAGLRIGPAWLVAVVDDALVDDGHVPATPTPCSSDQRCAGTSAAGPRRCAVEQLVERTFRHRALAERRAVLAVLLERGDLEREAQRAEVDVGTLARRVRAVLGALARAAAPAAPCSCYGALPADAGADGVFLAALPVELAQDARRALAALRVLYATRRGPHTSFDLAHVERELAALGSARLGTALRVLLARALNRALPADSYLDYTTRERSAHDVLGGLHELGAALGARAHACDPFLPPLAAAEQLLAALRALVDERRVGPITPQELALWQVRQAYAAAPPRALAAALAEVARRAADARDMRTAAAAARDAVAALLDAGAPEAALEVARALGAECEPLAELARTALDDTFAEPPIGAPKLRNRGAAAGRGIQRDDALGRGPHVRARDVRCAAEFGATVLCVARALGADCEVVHLDVASGCGDVASPALRTPAATEQDDASLAVAQLDPGARRVVAHWIHDAAGVARGWLQLEFRHGLPLDSRALAALVAAWKLAVVCAPRAAPRATADVAPPVAHRATPRAASVASVEGPVSVAARELIARLGVGTAQRRWSLFVADQRLGGEAFECLSLDGSALAQETLGDLTREGAVDAVGRGPAHSEARSRVRAPGSALPRGALSWMRLAQGGGAHLDERALSASEALQRALGSDEPIDIAVDPRRLAAHASAQSGFVFGAASPLGARYVLALEAPRREQFSRTDGLAWQHALAAEALHIDLARRSAACASLGEGAVALPMDEPDALHLARRVAAAAQSGCAVALVGPAGSGRRSLACQLHVEARRSGRVVQVVLTPTRGAPSERASMVGSGLCALGVDELGASREPAGDTTVLVGVERLDAASQLALAAHIARAAVRGADVGIANIGIAIEGDVSAGLAVVLPAAPRVLLERGQLVPELAARLAPWSLVLPALGDVRHRIPAIVAALLERVARRRAAAPRQLTDGALGLLWRGTWPCNVLDLSAVAERLAADGAGPDAPPCTQAEVASAVAAIGLEPVSRLASREPRASDVASAVWSTRTAGGRINKARAAAWLGWDADTLAARLVDLGFNDLAAAAQALPMPAGTPNGQTGRDPSARRETGPLTFREEVLPPSEAPPGAGGRRESNCSKGD